MKPEEFCYWLQGMFELTDAKTLDERQTELIRQHLDLVFQKVTGPKTVPWPKVPMPAPRAVSSDKRYC